MAMLSPDDSIPTRQSLLQRLKNWEDQESWQDFFNTYWRLIYNLAVHARLTDAEAQEVVQETVISVAKKIGDYKADPSFGSFKSWLLLVARRRIADQFRKRPRLDQPLQSRTLTDSRTPTVERIADPASLSLDQFWEQQWQQNLMDVAMERVKQAISPRLYLLFYQQVVKEWPAQKVAQQYNVSLAQAYTAKYRVSRLIKQEVRRLEAAAGGE